MLKVKRAYVWSIKRRLWLRVQLPRVLHSADCKLQLRNVTTKHNDDGQFDDGEVELNTRKSITKLERLSVRNESEKCMQKEGGRSDRFESRLKSHRAFNKFPTLKRDALQERRYHKEGASRLPFTFGVQFFMFTVALCCVCLQFFECYVSLKQTTIEQLLTLFGAVEATVKLPVKFLHNLQNSIQSSSDWLIVLRSEKKKTLN